MLYFYFVQEGSGDCLPSSRVSEPPTLKRSHDQICTNKDNGTSEQSAQMEAGVYPSSELQTRLFSMPGVSSGKNATFHPIFITTEAGPAAEESTVNNFVYGPVTTQHQMMSPSSASQVKIRNSKDLPVVAVGPASSLAQSIPMGSVQ